MHSCIYEGTIRHRRFRPRPNMFEYRRRFFANIDQVREMGYPEIFIRMWEYYLCYCEGGFAERYIGDVQMMFAKPLHRWNPLVKG